VQLIYHLYASGKGLKALANHLNKAGYRTKHNRLFSINGVATILDNVIYNGKISWLKIENGIQNGEEERILTQSS
jgi:site-specific DNA recombinase